MAWCRNAWASWVWTSTCALRRWWGRSEIKTHTHRNTNSEATSQISAKSFCSYVHVSEAPLLEERSHACPVYVEYSVLYMSLNFCTQNTNSIKGAGSSCSLSVRSSVYRPALPVGFFPFLQKLMLPTHTHIKHTQTCWWLRYYVKCWHCRCFSVSESL